VCAKKFVEKFVTAGLSFDRGLPDTSKMYRRAAFHTEVVQVGLVRLVAKRLPHESFALSMLKLRQVSPRCKHGEIFLHLLRPTLFRLVVSQFCYC
jgi:hypothetical protein